MESEQRVIIVRQSLGFGDYLFLLFLGLQLSGKINWNWGLVAMPLWAPLIWDLAKHTILPKETK